MVQIRGGKRFHRPSLIILILMLLLRFPVLMVGSSLLDSDIIMAVYRDGSYLCAAALIVLQRRRLTMSNITVGAVGFFAALPFVPLVLGRWCETVTGQSFGISPVQMIAAVALVAFLWKKGDARLIRQPPRRVAVWMTITVVVATLAALAFHLADAPAAATATRQPGTLLALCLGQLCTAAVAEEPLFRGFLWGFLREYNCPDGWIVLIQMALFMLGHSYYLATLPFSFWVVVPVAALLLGLIAWRSRSVSYSMVAHGILNGLGEFLRFYV